jgi:hypothetical protein
MASLFERLLGEDTPDEQVDLEARQERADDALRERIDSDARPIEDCAVTGVAVVNEGPDGEPVVVPIARFSLGETVESPDHDRVWELVGTALPALVDAFEGVFVRHYDVQFTLDGDELFEAEECRRVAVAPALAERLVTEPGFDVAALREAMLEVHDIDTEIAPVAWGECEDYSDRNNAAIVTGGAVAAAGASASAASCAGAASAGAGGGAC